MSIIFVDQTCGLSESDAKKVGLELLRWNNETEIENQFGDAFKEAMALDEDIIYLHPARKLSTQVAVAINFKRTQTVNYKNKFLLIDCGTIGMGYGLCAYMLGIQNKNYKSTSEQIEYLEHNKFAVLRYSSATGTLNSPIYKIFDGVEEKVGVASGINSATFNEGTKANKRAQTVVGKYNEPRTDTLFEVGVGINDTSRKTGFMVFDGSSNFGLISPDGSVWKITIDNAGVLTPTKVS